MVDARAAALRSRVEELARASYKERDQGFTAGVSTELMRAGMQFPQGQVPWRRRSADVDPPVHTAATPATHSASP